MDDDRVVISSALVFSPETVASRSFNVVFRGYDQNEVRTFLKRVADELTTALGRESELRRNLQEALDRAAHPELDEEVLTTALGEHAARLLTNAREAATAMLSDAETRSARVLQDAEGKIARVRAEADTLLARRTEEAERLTMGLRQAAEADARAVRERARAEAEAEVESARTQGREMVAEARSVRERMLADLTRRQRIAETQVEQLRSVRQRLLQAYGVVRRTVDEATAELGRAESDTRPVVEAAADHLAAPTGPVPVVRPGEAGSPGPLAPPGLPGSTGPGAPPPVPPGSMPPPSAPPHEGPAPVGRPIPTSRPVQPGAAQGGPPAQPRAPAQAGPGRAAPPSPIGGLGSVPPPDRARSAPPGAASPPEPPPAAAVEELFARMRAGQVADPGADAPTSTDFPTPRPAGAESAGQRSTTIEAPPQSIPHGAEGAGAPSDAADRGNPDDATSDADESVLYRRDELLDPIDADLARQLKRVLQDEQNEVLDRLRRQRRPVAVATLPDFVSQTERYQVAAAPLLRTAAHRGAGFVAAVTEGPVELSEPSERVAEEWAADLAVDIVIPLRERLESALKEADDAEDGASDAGADATVADRLSASYRQWKVQQIEQIARHHVTAAFVRGAFAATPAGTALRWVVDDETPCPDCDDNALAGPTPKGQEFPTGQTHPPAHEGCRCVLVTADSP